MMENKTEIIKILEYYRDYVGMMENKLETIRILGLFRD